MRQIILKLFKITPLVLGCTLLGLVACSNTGFEKTKSGILYKIHNKGNTKQIKLGDFVEMNFKVMTDKDSVLTSTFITKKPAMFKVEKSRSIGDLMDVFPMLSEKDSATVKVLSDSLFDARKGAMRPPFIKPKSYVFFVIKILKVMNQQQFDKEMQDKRAQADVEKGRLRKLEPAAIAKYLFDNHFKPDSTKEGVLYVTKSVGTGETPKPGDTLFVNYTGHTLNGKIFDTNDEGVAKANKLFQPQRKMQGGYGPFKYPVGQRAVIEGWDSYFLTAHKGTKATLIIPSRLAYKEMDQGIIPPYSTLVFDVELVDVKKGKGLLKTPQTPPIPPMPPQRGGSGSGGK